MRLGKTVVTFQPERALGEPEEDEDVFSETTRQVSSRPTRRYGDPPERPRRGVTTERNEDTLRTGDTLPARSLFEETEDELDTLVVETPEQRIPRPRERVLTPAPALFEDSGIFRL